MSTRHDDAFPEFHYPRQAVPLPGTAKLSHGCGCFTAANFNGTGKAGRRGQFSFQYHHGYSGGGGRSLVAVEPMLPFLKPNKCASIPIPALQDLGGWAGKQRSFEDRAANQAVYLYETHPELIWGSALDFLQDSYVDQINSHFKRTYKYKQRQELNPYLSVQKMTKTKGRIPGMMDLLDDVLYDIHPDMLVSLLQEDLSDSIIKQYFDSDYYGGCVAYQSLPSSARYEGLLFYPSGPTFEVLNIQSVPPQSGSIYTVMDSPSCHFAVSSPIKQIEAVSVPHRATILAGVRTDYDCCIMNVTMKKNKVKGLVSNVIHSQQKIASIALSPYILGECLLGLDTGGIQLIEGGRPRCILDTPQLGHQSPIRCHFGGHPRLVVTNQKTNVNLLDCREPKGSVSCLLSLPLDYLPHYQEICIAKQHPSNRNYHFVATQDVLLLLDERYPNYTALHWYHHLSSPPNSMDIIPQAVTSDDLNSDLVVLGSQHLGEVHCFQCNELTSQTPESTCPPWKLCSTDDWLNILPEYPAESLDSVRSRLNRPHVGVCAAKRRVCVGCEAATTVFKLSMEGDMFFQSFSQSEPGRWDKTLALGPGCPKVTISDESLTNCKRWTEGVLRQQPTETAKTAVGFDLIDHSDTILAINILTKSSSIPDEACKLCSKSGSNPRRDPSHRCPACGVRVSDSDLLLQSVDEGGILARGDGGDVVGLPWKINPAEYRDETSRTLYHRWVHGYDGQDEEDWAGDEEDEAGETCSQRPSQLSHKMSVWSPSHKRPPEWNSRQDDDTKMTASSHQGATELAPSRLRTYKRVKRNIVGF